MPFTNLNFSFHQVPITAGWTEVYESLPNTSTHGRQRDSTSANEAIFSHLCVYVCNQHNSKKYEWIFTKLGVIDHHQNTSLEFDFEGTQ